MPPICEKGHSYAHVSFPTGEFVASLAFESCVSSAGLGRGVQWTVFVCWEQAQVDINQIR